MECVENFSNENCVLLGYYAVLMYSEVEASNHKLLKCPSIYFEAIMTLDPIKSEIPTTSKTVLHLDNDMKHMQ